MMNPMPGIIPQKVQEYAREFEVVLRAAGVKSFVVDPVLAIESELLDSNPKRLQNQIAALPAGYSPEDVPNEPTLTKGMRWDDAIFVEVLRKCDRDAIPAILKLKG